MKLKWEITKSKVNNMKSNTSTLKILFASACLLIGTNALNAQNAKMEKEFIFFVDGVNVQVPEITGTIVVNDPRNPESGNKVLRFDGGSWAEQGFVWPTNDGGVDMTDFTSTNYGDTDTLFLKILIDPINTDAGLKLNFFDKGIVGPINSADLRFRMSWSIPSWYRDGQWHELAIPLPPSTFAALESAKLGQNVDGSALGVEVDSLLQYWTYGGAWGSGQGVWGPTEANWKEFEWDAVEMVGFHFDWDGAFGPVYVDDFYIGGKATDLSVATAAPAEVGAVSIANANLENTLTWSSGDGVAGYQVYYSDKPFTSVTDADVQYLGRVTGETSFKHSPLAPHPSLASNIASYYAVTSISDFGTENQSIASSYKSVTGAVKSTPWIQEVDEATAFSILDDMNAGIVSKDNFPTNILPFVITPESKVTEGNVQDDEHDLSAKAWAVYFEGAETGNFIIFYAEVKDNLSQYVSSMAGAISGWDFDSIELGFGGYSVESFLNGSSHDFSMRGEEPDYQFRLGKYSDSETGFVYENFRFSSLMPNSVTNVSQLFDESNNVIGYKLMTAINVEQLQGGELSDKLVDLPNDAEMRLYPFTFAINDNDGFGRETQSNWSYKPNTRSSWWNSPNQLPSVAFAGKNVIATNENFSKHSFVMESTSAPIGGSFMIPITLETKTGESISSVQFEFMYPSELTIDNISFDNSLFTKLGWEVASGENNMIIAVAGAGSESFTGFDTLAVVYGRVGETAEVNSTYTLSFTSVQVDELMGDVYTTTDGFVLAETLVVEPSYGDVSLNGHVTAFDASLILKNLVSAIELTEEQLNNADVTSDETVSTLDASVILQYVVGLVESLYPPEQLRMTI